MVAAGLAVLVAGCKKDKEKEAVVEEVPAAAAPKETDTSATLAEEPNLQQVGKDKPGSAKNTFHPGKGKGKDKGAAAPSEAASQAGFSDAGHYVVQVAIFKSKKQAAALVEKLSGQGYPAYVAEVTDPVPQLAGTYHRVRIGKFLKVADARAFGDNTLKPLGYDYWVDNKKNDGVGGSGSGYSAPATEETAPAPAAEAPAPRKGKKAKTAAAAPSEPPAPPSGTWGAPNGSESSAPNSGESAPAGDSWSAPAKAEAPASKPAASELPGTAPSSASPSASAPASPSASPAPAGKTDTGKVNLDEW
jgi:hypothetical protein